MRIEISRPYFKIKSLYTHFTDNGECYQLSGLNNNPSFHRLQIGYFAQSNPGKNSIDSSFGV
jgi:hypothetical protein